MHPHLMFSLIFHSCWVCLGGRQDSLCHGLLHWKAQQQALWIRGNARFYNDVHFIFKQLLFLTFKSTNALPDYKVLGRIASSWNGGRSRWQHALLVVKISDWILHPKKVKCLRRNKCKLETLLPLSLSGICWLAVNNTSASICIYSKYHQRWISSSTAL